MNRSSTVNCILEKLLKLFGLLHLSLRATIGRLCGYIFFIVPTPDRRIAILQLKWLLPEMNAALTVARMYANLGQTALETLNLIPFRSRLNDSFTFSGSPDLPEVAAADPAPRLFLSAHTGNWELLAASAHWLGIELRTLGATAKVAVLQHLLNALRLSYGVPTIWRGDSTRDIIRSFREKRSIAALLDQDLRIDGVFSSFFGIQAKTPSRLIDLARRYDAEIYTTFIFRTGLFSYTIYTEKIDTTLSTQEILDLFNQRLEKYVRLYPDQWVWLHKRWRSLPAGKRLSTTEYIKYLSELSQHPTLEIKET